jgi:2-methylcitrate dehydratase PrpD
VGAVTLLGQLIDVASASYDPDQARRAGGRALFDHLACRANGRRRAPAEVGAAGAAVYGDLDDIHWSSLTHPGAIVWTAIEEGGVPDDRRWRAAHMGYEVTARLGRALGPEHRRYWHATTTAGTVGGAVAVAVGTQANPITAAAHAVSVAGGSILCILQRTATRMLHRDHAAATAVRCARLSRLTGAEDGLEHPRGMFAAMGGSPEGLLDAGQPPAIGAVSFRRHETSGFCQAAVEAAAELAPASPEARVELEVPEAALALAGIEAPRDADEAWWSCRHAVAVTLLGGSLTDTAVDEPAVARLRERMQVSPGAVSRVTVDGRSAERERARPLTDDDLVAKWRRLNPDLEPPMELLA